MTSRSVGIQVALGGGAEDTGEDLLIIGPAPRAIPAATRLAGDGHGRARLLGAPIGGIEGRLEQKTEDGRKLVDEMLLKPHDRRMATGLTPEQTPELLDVLATRDREPVGRHRAGVMCLARAQRGLQDLFRRPDKRGVG